VKSAICQKPSPAGDTLDKIKNQKSNKFCPSQISIYVEWACNWVIWSIIQIWNRCTFARFQTTRFKTAKCFNCRDWQSKIQQILSLYFLIAVRMSIILSVLKHSKEMKKLYLWFLQRQLLKRAKWHMWIDRESKIQ
jgi:hypothetical protein